MKRLPRNHAHRVSPAGLIAALEDHIKVHHRTTAELATLTGFVDGTVRLRLLVLEERGIIHKTAQRCPNGMGLTFVWHFGPAPAVTQPAEDDERPIPGELPRRFFTRQYPNVGRRDPLVAALFGMAAAGPALVPRAPTSLLELER